MIRIKRLYSFILQTFFPILLATFSVCLFILLMQFLWQYVNDMVGKGVGIVVLAELFFYAALSFVPMALPLSILLASLMTFGNLGEHFELLAMKASGISLLRIMRPLIITVAVIVGVSFYFQNNILPPAQTKMYTILISLKQKSPELDIPEGTFYKEIPGYNVYVRDKDKKEGLLLDMMIYDYSKGFENAAVIVADTGKLSMSEDKTNLILTLYSGESFENLGTRKTRSLTENVPYRRETFGLRMVLIPFDTNFNMADESIMGNRDLGKNVLELTQFIDSVKTDMDSLNLTHVQDFKEQNYLNTFRKREVSQARQNEKADSLFQNGFQTYFDQLKPEKQISYCDKAITKIENIRNAYFFTMTNQTDMQKQIRGHQIQMNKKFTLSLACLLFFFIGAPLGAIIRKGGMGMPVVLSVFLFLFYYTIDTFGVKMARQAVWSVEQGVWLSSLILAALGVFFTYKAVNDSVMMSPDVWKNALQRLIGKKEVRNYSKKELIIVSANYSQDIAEMEDWNRLYEIYKKENEKLPFYFSFWKKGFEDEALDGLVERMEHYISDLLNSDENLIIGKLMDYPIVRPIYLKIMNHASIRWICAIVFPIGILLYLFGIARQKEINQNLQTVYRVNNDLAKELNNLQTIK